MDPVLPLTMGQNRLATVQWLAYPSTCTRLFAALIDTFSRSFGFFPFMASVVVHEFVCNSCLITVNICGAVSFSFPGGLTLRQIHSAAIMEALQLILK